MSPAQVAPNAEDDQPPRVPVMSRRNQLLLGVVMALYFSLAVGWGVLIPPFEKADEIHHFAYAQYLAEEVRLPLGSAPDYHHSLWEAHQPPVFYAAAAIVYRTALSLGVPRTETGAYWNRIGNSFQDTAMLFDHPERPGQVGFPYDLYVVRLVAMLFGLLALLATYHLARLILADDLWASVAAAALLMPQFTHFASAAGNDAAVAAMGGLFLIQLIRVSHGPLEARLGPVVLGVLLGLTVLSKLNGIALAPALLILALGTPRRLGRPHPDVRRLRARLSQIAAASAAAAVVVAPWWLTAWRITGEWLPVPSRLGADFAFDVVPRGLSDPWFVNVFAPDLFRSYVGKAGFMRLGLPATYYVLALLTAAAAVFGLVRWWRHRQADVPPHSKDVAALLLAVLCVAASVVWHNMTVSQPQGRYLYPAAAAITVIVALGWRQLLRWPAWPARLRRIQARSVAALLLVLAIASFNAAALYHIWSGAYADYFLGG